MNAARAEAKANGVAFLPPPGEWPEEEAANLRGYLLENPLRTI